MNEPNETRKAAPVENPSATAESCGCDQTLAFLVLRGWLADGAGGIIALFLFEFTKPMQNGDRRLWVVVGDFPRACVRVLAEDSPHAAIERYVGLLERWINKVMIFDAASWNEFPLELEPSLRQAKLLRLKVDFLRQEVLPLLE